jgi:hypothetical protein
MVSTEWIVNSSNIPAKRLRSARGIEPRTSCTRSRNHASRPSGHYATNVKNIYIYISMIEVVKFPHNNKHVVYHTGMPITDEMSTSFNRPQKLLLLKQPSSVDLLSYLVHTGTGTNVDRPVNRLKKGHGLAREHERF